MEVIDSQAREDVGKIWYRIGLIETVLWGVNKDNGLKSEVVKNTQQITDLLQTLRHYIDAEREETCIGLKELARRDAFKAEIEEEVTEVQVAKINAGAQQTQGKWQAWSAAIAQILTLAGIIFVAVFK